MYRIIEKPTKTSFVDCLVTYDGRHIQHFSGPNARTEARNFIVDQGRVVDFEEELKKVS